MGFMLEKMLLPIVGSGVSLIIICASLCVFITALFLGFNLINVNFYRVKLFNKKTKNGVCKNAVNVNI